jgi:GNAT superfamily N-acetyltransferase
MSVTVRPSRAADAPSLPSVEISAGTAFLAVPGLEWIAGDGVMSVSRHSELIAGGGCWVAADKTGKISGFLAGEAFSDALHICELSVLSEAQGQGVGSALVKAAINWAEAKGKTAVTLSTFRDVAFNAPWYARMGFEELDQDSMTNRMAYVLSDEIAHGLPGERRCAMQYRIVAGPRRAS